MHYTFRNVNDAFKGLVTMIAKEKVPLVRTPSRVGEVIQVREPVMITYTHPRERVLFNRARDCNPFFHLFESLWMLAGRNDVAPLAFYVPKMVDFTNDGKTVHGAYGYRWRVNLAVEENSPAEERISGDEYRPIFVDQLEVIVDHLRKQPNSRRAVLQMWNVQDDLLEIDRSKDVCCNTHIYFSISDIQRLDMMVCNRSNDLIWGMLGANVVHMSFLQEYLAGCLGLEVGEYHQVTNNLHVYTERWKPDKWLAEYTNRTMHSPPLVSYQSKGVPSLVLVEKPEVFDEEVKRFIDDIDGNFTEPFLKSVAQPMCLAFRRYKLGSFQGDEGALAHIDKVWAWDWRLAGTEWLLRRVK